MKQNSEARVPDRQERPSTLPVEGQVTESNVSQLAIDLSRDLREQTMAARRLLLKAEAVGDLPAAISALRESIRLLELCARLTGQLRETQQLNVLNVHIDSERARRIAEVYLQRHSTAK